MAHAVITAFPFLSLPEDAHSSFFIISSEQKVKPTFNLRKLVAELQNEAGGSRGSAIDIEVVPEDLEAKKKQLAGKEILIKLVGDDVPILTWKISADIALDKVKLGDFIENQIAPKVNRQSQNASIQDFVDEGKAAHAMVEGVAKDGISVAVEKNMELIRDAVLKDVFEVNLDVESAKSYVFNGTPLDFGELKLLAAGRSNFAGSPEGRAFNIQKGLNEKMNNIIVPPGAEFSFNSFLGPITSSQGWAKALGIFGGGSLAPTLGGGLCQVSTTMYRAALLTGLPILERKPHSLYVSYYKQFGEGLDSTIYSTGPDLVFLNDTPSYILIQSYVDGDDAYVKFFGTSDGRKSELAGPYRSHDIPEEKGYKPPQNEIVWFRTVELSDGSKKEEMITSRYKTLPKHPR
ncbi:VanW family protein [Candidatus Peregrinibacteria bacterium]|nr:VanW family protein [Candidatus Peregrinibacteria bacterium]